MRKKAGSLFAAVLGVLMMTAVQGYARGVTAFRQEQDRKIAAHVAQQQEDEMRFRQSLKSMSPAEKARAITEHRNERQAKNDAFSAQLHRENVAFLKTRLLKSAKLTEADKEELIACFEQQSSEDMVYRKQRFDKNVAFFEQTANDPSQSIMEKKTRIREYFTARRSENWQEGEPEPEPESDRR